MSFDHYLKTVILKLDRSDKDRVEQELREHWEDIDGDARALEPEEIFGSIDIYSQQLSASMKTSSPTISILMAILLNCISFIFNIVALTHIARIIESPWSMLSIAALAINLVPMVLALISWSWFYRQAIILHPETQLGRLLLQADLFGTFFLGWYLIALTESSISLNVLFVFGLMLGQAWARWVAQERGRWLTAALKTLQIILPGLVFIGLMILLFAIQSDGSLESTNQGIQQVVEASHFIVSPLFMLIFFGMLLSYWVTEALGMSPFVEASLMFLGVIVGPLLASLASWRYLKTLAGRTLTWTLLAFALPLLLTPIFLTPQIEDLAQNIDWQTNVAWSSRDYEKSYFSIMTPYVNGPLGMSNLFDERGALTYAIIRDQTGVEIFVEEVEKLQVTPEGVVSTDLTPVEREILVSTLWDSVIDDGFECSKKPLPRPNGDWVNDCGTLSYKKTALAHLPDNLQLANALVLEGGQRALLELRQGYGKTLIYLVEIK
jgi:hypothetical protein